LGASAAKGFRVTPPESKKKKQFTFFGIFFTMSFDVSSGRAQQRTADVAPSGAKDPEGYFTRKGRAFSRGQLTPIAGRRRGHVIPAGLGT